MRWRGCKTRFLTCNKSWDEADRRKEGRCPSTLRVSPRDIYAKEKAEGLQKFGDQPHRGVFFTGEIKRGVIMGFSLALELVSHLPVFLF